MKRTTYVGLGLVIGFIIGGGLLAGCGALAEGASPMFMPNHGGMMGGSGMGGMMGQGNLQPFATAAPDDNRAVDQTIEVVAQNMRFEPSRVTVRAGERVRFVITNRDGFAHNFVSPQANIGERVIAGGATQSLVWTAPARRGTYRAQCTYHPGMVLDIEGE